MERFSITRKIEIDAAHRVPDHGSKCQHVHGHRYVIEATCEGTLFDAGEQRGMVFDFGFLKDLMVKHIHDHCDHAMIVWEDDPLREDFLGCCGKVHTVPYTPTAENLARYWFELIQGPITVRSVANASLTRLRVYETPNCWADFPTIPQHIHNHILTRTIAAADFDNLEPRIVAADTLTREEIAQLEHPVIEALPEQQPVYRRPECIYHYCANVPVCKERDVCIHQLGAGTVEVPL